MRIVRRARTGLLIILSFFVLGLADAPPRSLKAQLALRKYDRAVERARSDYDATVNAASKVLAAELDEALKLAMKSGSLDEANSIKAARDARVTTARPEKGSRLGGLDGSWSLVYGNGVRRTYVISGTVLTSPRGAGREKGRSRSSTVRSSPTPATASSSG